MVRASVLLLSGLVGTKAPLMRQDSDPKKKKDKKDEKRKDSNLSGRFLRAFRHFSHPLAQMCGSCSQSGV